VYRPTGQCQHLGPTVSPLQTCAPVGLTAAAGFGHGASEGHGWERSFQTGLSWR
jgi:hypothetical protein